MVDGILNVIPHSAFVFIVTIMIFLFVIFGDIYLIKLILGYWRGLITGEGVEAQQISRPILVVLIVFFTVGTIGANAWFIYKMVLGG